VSCLDVDNFGRSCLHYAAQSHHQFLVDKLIKEGASSTQLDIHGFSPLVLYLKGKLANETVLYYGSSGKFDTIFEMLI